ncbi:MAG: hypothetical protein AB1797_11940 [bacterium]
MKEPLIAFDQIVNLARQLSPLDKLRLIECLAPDLEAPLQTQTKLRRRSLRGLLKGCSISPEEIDQARQEMWTGRFSFQRQGLSGEE